MADDRQILKESLGVPYVWIYTRDNSLIRINDGYNNNLLINEFIERFKYKYDEENDDTCEITLGFTKIIQLENPLFKPDTILKVEWGYILPYGKLLKSITRTVAIRDRKTEYTSTKINLTLICSDLPSYLKNIKNNRTSDKDLFSDWLKEVISGEFIASRTIKGKTTVEKKNDDMITTGMTVESLLMTQDEYINSLKEEKSLNENQEAVIGPLNGWTTFKENDLKIKGKSKSLMQAMQEKVNENPDGPSFINTRDNVIDIITRDFNQKPYKGYTYMGKTGELIEFKPNTNVVTVKADEVETSFFNQQTKEVETTKISKIIETIPNGLNALDIKVLWGRVRSIFEHNSDPANAFNQIPLDTIIFEKDIKIQGTHATASNVDQTTRVRFEGPVLPRTLKFSAKEILQLPYVEELRRKAFADNYTEKKLQRQFEARAKIIGDPSIIVSKIYRFNNVANYDSGDWYCTGAEHDITPNQGYIVNMDLIKKPHIIATLIEKKKYSNGQLETVKPFYEDSYIKFQDSNDSDVNFNQLNSQDISQRLEEQRYFQNFLQNDSDIAFDHHWPNKNIYNKESNSNEV
jgi:hypothetical protein